MYEVQPLGAANALSGQVYSNAKLALLSAAGRDETLWHSFITRIDTFNAVSRNIIVRGNYIAKVNVTFEGIRWNATNLFQPSPEEPFRTDIQTIQHAHQGNCPSLETPPKRPRLSNRSIRDSRKDRLGAALPLLPEIQTETEAISDKELLSDEDCLVKSNRA